MADDAFHPGPTNVTVTVEYDYAGKRYRLNFDVDRRKRRVDMICFGEGIGKQIRDAWKPDSTLKGVPPDASVWECKTVDPPSEVVTDPLAAAPMAFMNEHTPICWHDDTCEFWCA